MKRFFFRGHNSNGIVQFFSRFMPAPQSFSDVGSLRSRLGGCGNPVEICKVVIASFKSRPLLSIFSLVLIILIPIYYLTVKFTNPASEAAWFDESFQYRKAISITNTSGSNLTDFQVSISIGTSAPIATGKMKSDCSDIRITDQNGKLLPHWIEENNPGCNAVADAKVWVKVPSISTSGGILYAYYGNPNASNIADGNGVFEFFDDFKNPVFDTNKWVNNDSATVNISNGMATFTETNDIENKNIYAKSYKSTSSIVFESFQNVTTTTGTEFGGLSMKADNTSPTHKYKLGYANGGGSFWYWNSATWTQSTGSTVPFTNFAKSKIVFSGTNYQAFVNDVQVQSTMTNEVFSKHVPAITAGLQTGVANFDWVIVRKYASTQPTTTLSGTEEKSLGPVAYWKFDEGVGSTAYDSSINKNNGTLSGSTLSWASEDKCISGKCIYFDGNTGYVNTGNKKSLNPTEEFTVSMWVNNQRATGKHTFLMRNASGAGGYGLYQSNTETISFFVYWSGASQFCTATNYTLPQNQWTHITGQFKQDNYLKIYINGVEKGSCSPTNSGPIGISGGNLLIGYIGWWGGNNTYFKGYVDEPKIYSYARTPAQIKSDYNSGLARQSSSKGTSVSMGSPGASNLSNGLVGYWKMDETTSGVGSTAYDASGNNYHGINNGSTSPAVVAGKFGNAKAFNGANNYISIAYTNPINTTSVFAWFKRTGSPAGGYHIIFGPSNIEISIPDPGGQLRIGVTTATMGRQVFNSGSGLIDGNWHFVGLVYDGLKLDAYIDGKKTGSLTVSGNLSGTVQEIGRYGSNTYVANGYIDETRIYNRALSPKEVTDLYNYAPGPVGYWDFEEGNGATAYDRSGNGNNGAFSNNPLWTNGKFGKALNFNGTTSYINVGNSQSLSPSYAETISAWVKLDVAPSSQSSAYPQIIGKRDTDTQRSYFLAFEKASSKIYWEIKDSAGTYYTLYSTKTNWNPNEWYHITASFDGSQTTDNTKVFVNGILDNKGTWNLTYVPQTTATTRIGGGNYFLDGSLDEVKIYNYIRTPSQVIEDMNGGHPLGGSPVGSQVGYWKMDEGYGSILYDSGPNKLNGTLGTGSSSPTWNNNGKFEKALSFDGNDYVSLVGTALDNIGVSGDFTISTWNYQLAFSGLETIVCQGYGSPGGGHTYGRWLLGTLSNKGFISLYGGASSPSYKQLTGTISLPTNQWNYITAVFSRANSKVNLYVNGVYDSSITWDGYIEAVDPNRINLGYNIGSLSYYMNGLIDEVKFYNGELTADEIKIDYNRGQAMQMGTLSSGVGNTASSNAASQEYCVPGDTVSCLPPVAEYKFEEGSGNTAQDSSGNNLGVGFTGAPTRVSGKNGKALKLNGTSDYLAGTRKVLSGNLSLGAWIKTTSNDSAKSYAGNAAQNVIGDSTGGVALGFGITGGKAQYNYYTSLWNTVNGTSTINDGKWHYIAVTHKSDGSVILYVDGKQEATSTLAYNGSSAFNVIGRGYSADLFTGQLDDIRIYNYVRTPAQVSWDYNHGAPVAWWKMDECQGVSLNDSSGNNLIGNINIGASGSQTTAGNCSTAGTAWGVGATGRFNSSLNFDGVDDYVNIPDPASGILDFGTNDFTTSTWFKTTTSNATIIGKYCSYPLYNTTISSGVINSRIGFDASTNYIGSNGSTVNDNVWHNIVTVYKRNGNMTRYLDGKIYGSAVDISSSSTITVNNTNSFTLAAACGPSQTFSGQIDDTRVYNYALTQDQVKQLYNGGAINFGPATGSP